MNQSGYSQAAQNYILALDRGGRFDIKLKIFGNKPSKPAISDTKYEYFMKMTRKEDDPERVLIYHCIPNIQKRIKKLKKNIGFGTFETFDPPDQWIDILNQNDAIVAPSYFNFKIFAHKQLEKPIFYIPHTIDTDVYNVDVQPLVERSKFTFLFMGIWRERKGYKQLIEAWLKEFKREDNVQLIIKTDKPKKAGEYIAKAKKEMGINKGFAPILLENKIFDEIELPKFIKSVDCLISPTMGEGFGYPGLQCMALGIPVIITNFSGCKDYAKEDTANLIEPRGFTLRADMDAIPQFRSKKWAFIEVRDIQAKLRYVTRHSNTVKRKAINAYKYVRDRFNYKIVENEFYKMISSLYET
jgi:glycosyltransferase involved in cell wall biosynthesis